MSQKYQMTFPDGHKEAFENEAKKYGLSVSAWLIGLGRGQLPEEVLKSLPPPKPPKPPKRRKKRRQFTEDECDYIREHHDEMTHNEIADHLGVSRLKVNEWAISQGLRKQLHRKFTDTESDWIRSNFAEKTHQEMADHLGRPEMAVKLWCLRNGLRKQKGFTIKPFTQDECDYITAHFPDETYRAIAEHLGRTVGSVSQWCYRNGLRKVDNG